MSLYSQFKTDTTLERQGIELDYGHCVVTVARAGGANKRFSRVLEQKTKPYRRAIQTDTMDPAIAERLLKETYAETVILKWETRCKDEAGNVIDPNGEVLKIGIEGEDGELLPFNQENVLNTLKNLPEIWTDIQQQASRFTLFREAQLEDDAGN